MQTPITAMSMQAAEIFKEVLFALATLVMKEMVIVAMVGFFTKFACGNVEILVRLAENIENNTLKRKSFFFDCFVTVSLPILRNL